jgi:biotin carboxyl carrier protein
VAEIESLGGGRFIVTRDGRTQRAYAVSTRGESWVFVNGDVFVVGASKGVARREASADDASLAAPMPATVVSIDAAEGAEVKSGDTLIVLEAMKMELSIKAPRDGRVTRIGCRVGELVQPGIPLLEMS